MADDLGERPLGSHGLYSIPHAIPIAEKENGVQKMMFLVAPEALAKFNVTREMEGFSGYTAPLLTHTQIHDLQRLHDALTDPANHALLGQRTHYAGYDKEHGMMVIIAEQVNKESGHLNKPKVVGYRPLYGGVGFYEEGKRSADFTLLGTFEFDQRPIRDEIERQAGAAAYKADELTNIGGKIAGLTGPKGLKIKAAIEGSKWAIGEAEKLDKALHLKSGLELQPAPAVRMKLERATGNGEVKGFHPKYEEASFLAKQMESPPPAAPLSVQDVTMDDITPPTITNGPGKPTPPGHKPGIGRIFRR